MTTLEEMHKSMLPYVGYLGQTRSKTVNHLVIFGDKDRTTVAILNLGTWGIRKIEYSDSFIINRFTNKIEDPHFKKAKVQMSHYTIVPGKTKSLKDVKAGDIVKECSTSNVFICCSIVDSTHHRYKGIYTIDASNPKHLLIPDEKDLNMKVIDAKVSWVLRETYE